MSLVKPVLYTEAFDSHHHKLKVIVRHAQAQYAQDTPYAGQFTGICGSGILLATIHGSQYRGFFFFYIRKYWLPGFPVKENRLHLSREKRFVGHRYDVENSGQGRVWSNQAGVVVTLGVVLI